MQNAHNAHPEEPQNQTMFTPLESLSVTEPPSQAHGTHGLSANTPQTPAPHSATSQPMFYTHDDELDGSDGDDQNGQSMPFVLPFQPSTAMPPVVGSHAHSGNAQVTGDKKHVQPGVQVAPRRRSFSLLKTLLIVAVVVVTLFVGGILVFAQSATPSPPRQTAGPTHQIPRPPRTQQTPIPQATAAPTQTPSGMDTQGTASQPMADVPSAQILDQLRWMDAGLTLGDAIAAQRTASAFVDREMSYDYRSIGTPDTHGGTLTSATILLTPGAKARYPKNDVRLINNTLYNKIRDGKIIQQVTSIHPTLVKFQAQQNSPNQFAWVTVSFTLVQSKVDPATGKRTESVEMDAATGQPRVHQMSVILLRVAPDMQGPDAPMGGTGWLVNVYALDAKALPEIETKPTF